jgi:hypothetical protein
LLFGQYKCFQIFKKAPTYLEFCCNKQWYIFERIDKRSVLLNSSLSVVFHAVSAALLIMIRVNGNLSIDIKHKQTTGRLLPLENILGSQLMITPKRPPIG